MMNNLFTIMYANFFRLYLTKITEDSKPINLITASLCY